MTTALISYITRSHLNVNLKLANHSLLLFFSITHKNEREKKV
jgi:hypothetical protein